MPLAECVTTSSWYRADLSAATDTGQRQFGLNIRGVGAPAITVAPVQIQTDTVGLLQAGFETSLWVRSNVGTAPAFEIELVRLAGALPAGSVVRGEWNMAAILPTAARPFDWTRDGLTATMNGAFSAPSAATPLRLSWQACPGAAAFDCCSEVSLKLDEILSFVSRTWPVVPSV